MALEIRKIVSIVETTHTELDRPVDGLHRKVATGVVLSNPLAGVYQHNLDSLVDLGGPWC